MEEKKDSAATPEDGEDRDAPPEGDEATDRRRHPRVKAKLHMVFEDGRTAVKTRVVDISLGGVFLEMEKPPEAGTEIRLTPILPDKGPEKRPTRIKGRVVRVVEYDLENFPESRGGGIGVEFSDVSGTEQNVLSDIFRQGLEELKEDEEDGEDDEASKTGEWSQVAREARDEADPEG
jgi:c-di-GMP-binding flagellar brake protein YcgR